MTQSNNVLRSRRHDRALEREDVRRDAAARVADGTWSSSSPTTAAALAEPAVDLDPALDVDPAVDVHPLAAAPVDAPPAGAPPRGPVLADPTLAALTAREDAVSLAADAERRFGSGGGTGDRTAAGGSRTNWSRQYLQRLTAIDVVSGAVASSLASVLAFPGASAERKTIVAAVFTVGWMLILLLNRTYENRHLGLGSEEFKRVLNAGMVIIAVIAVFDFGLKLDLARRYVVVAVPIAVALDVAGRFVLRRHLHRRRYHGEAMSRVIAVGPMAAVAHMTAQLRTEAYHGLEIVGACIVDTRADANRSGTDLRDNAEALNGWDDRLYDELEVPVLGGIEDVGDAVTRLDASVVAVMSTGDLPAGALRRLAWSLERTGTELLVSPGLVEVAGPRLTIRPYSNLPLLHVDQPRLSGLSRVLKSGLDRVLAALGLLFLSPFMLLIAVLVRTTSTGPVFFKQTRIGLDGQPFRLIKFRSMVADADRQIDLLREQNENDGVLFKIKRDPRITAVGVKLRRFSLDELPQLFNVLGGSMSLVGPRPPLPTEVESYHSDVRRRLLVRPGITGLWQVSGRSDLSWDDSVRLDLRYVENWSMSLDFYILWRTVRAVLGGRGAY